MKLSKSVSLKSGVNKKCLTIVLAGLALTACSEDQQEQAKQVKEKAVAPAMEKAEAVVEEKVAAVTSEVKETVTAKTEEVKEAVTAQVEDVKEAVAEKVEATSNAVSSKVEEVKESVEQAAPADVEAASNSGAATEKTEAPAAAQTHVVKAAVTQFKPLVVFANPGDTIVWQNMNGHDTTSMKGMLPEGAETWQSAMGEIFSYTVKEEGAYLYKCTPHASMGMIGAIVVGNADNLDTIKASVDSSGEPKGMVNRVIRKVEKQLAKK